MCWQPLAGDKPPARLSHRRIERCAGTTFEIRRAGRVVHRRGGNQMKPKVGIIGDGNIGSALRRGLERAGYEVRAVGKGQVAETGRWAEVVMLAVPYGAIDDVI